MPAGNPPEKVSFTCRHSNNTVYFSASCGKIPKKRAGGEFDRHSTVYVYLGILRPPKSNFATDQTVLSDDWPPVSMLTTWNLGHTWR